MAKDILPRNAWGYVHGDAGLRQTEDNNLAAFRKWGLVPNRLVPFAAADLSTEIAGIKLANPIIIAPVGVSGVSCAMAWYGAQG
jgi:lactate 2-monooxygenase